jgi:hypothetical protein
MMLRTVPSQLPSDTRDTDRRSDDRDAAWSSASVTDGPLFAFESEEPTFESEALEGAPVSDDPREQFVSETTISQVRSHLSPTAPLPNEGPLDRVARPVPLDPHMSAAVRWMSIAMGTLAVVCAVGIGAFMVSPRGSDTDPVAIRPSTVPPPRTVAQNVGPAATATVSSVPAPPDNARRVTPFESAADTAPADAIATRLLADSTSHLDTPSPVVPSIEPAVVEPVTVEPVVPPAPLARAESDPPAVVEVGGPTPVSSSRIDQESVRDEEGIQRVLQRYQLAYEQLDAAAAQVVWPTVDVRGLARAFDSLTSQTLAFDRCELRIAGDAAEAVCRGVGTYVPKVGGQGPRQVPGEWSFQLERIEGTWTIAQTKTR